MKKFNLKKAKYEFRKNGLTHTEKNAMLSRILKKDVALPVRSPYLIPSTYFSTLSQSFAFASKRMVYALTLFAFILGGVGTLFAAEGAVPGDLLYPIKINVTESLRDVVAAKTGQSVEWEAQKAERRITEARILAADGKLDDVKRKEIETKFNVHLDNLNTDSNRGWEHSTTTRTTLDEIKNDHARSFEKRDDNKKNFVIQKKLEENVKVETGKLDLIKASSTDEQKSEIQKFENNIQDKVNSFQEEKKVEDHSRVDASVHGDVHTGNFFGNRSENKVEHTESKPTLNILK